MLPSESGSYSSESYAKKLYKPDKSTSYNKSDADNKYQTNNLKATNIEGAKKNSDIETKYLPKDLKAVIKVGLLKNSNFTASRDFCSLGKIEDSMILGIGIEKQIDNYFSLELEYLHSLRRKGIFETASNQTTEDIIRETKVMSHTLFVNALLYSRPVKSPIRPYLTFGVGPSFNSILDIHSTDTLTILQWPKKTNIACAWHIGIGLSSTHKDINFISEIRYFDKGFFKSQPTVDSATPNIVELHVQELIFLVGTKFNL